MSHCYDEHVHAGFRITGQEREAVNHRLSDAGFAWKCRWNGVSPERAPWQFRYASNAAMKRQIEARAA
jgi:hypothetical protein